MSLIKMNKIRLYIHKSVGSDVLRAVQKTSSVEFVEVDNEAFFPGEKKTFEFNYVSSRLDFAVEFLSKFEEVKGRWQKIKRAVEGSRVFVSERDIVRVAQSFYFNDIVDRVQDIEEKINVIEQMEFFWPKIEVEFENISMITKSFEIPEEIPINEIRLDLEEAIRDYENGCYTSALVMCRRAYEGALIEAYKSRNGKLIEEIKCKNCKSIIGKKYVGIAKLHKWAINTGLVTEKLKSVGFLVSDIGSGAAHPPLKEFPRDKEIARLGITATITLLKQIYAKLNNKGIK